MDAAHSILVIDAMRSRGVTAWVHGGWGVDALLGKQTRAHDDLDLVIQLSDWPKIVAAMTRLGYRVAQGAPPTNTVLLDGAGHQVDLHPVRFAPSGDGIYRMENGDDWTFPAAGFAGHGRIGIREVRCLTPEIEVLTRAGYELDADDWHDLDGLHERFGVAIPERPKPRA
jgi:lincosamide nucleotidyltransferase A/C/D/E